MESGENEGFKVAAGSWAIGYLIPGEGHYTDHDDKTVSVLLLKDKFS